MSSLMTLHFKFWKDLCCWSWRGLIHFLCLILIWTFRLSHCVVPENIHTPLPPLKIIGYSAGEGVFKGSYFRGLGGVHRKQLFQRVRNHEQNTESNVQSIVNTKTYERCFETKITTPGHWDEVKMLLFFFELASAPISRRTMCLWNEVETI